MGWTIPVQIAGYVSGIIMIGSSRGEPICLVVSTYRIIVDGCTGVLSCIVSNEDVNSAWNEYHIPLCWPENSLPKGKHLIDHQPWITDVKVIIQARCNCSLPPAFTEQTAHGELRGLTPTTCVRRTSVSLIVLVMSWHYNSYTNHKAPSPN